MTTSSASTSPVTTTTLTTLAAATSSSSGVGAAGGGGEVLLQGFLFHRSSQGMKMWRRRFCVLVKTPATAVAATATTAAQAQQQQLTCFEDERCLRVVFEAQISGLVLDIAEANHARRKGRYYFTLDLIQPLGPLSRKRVRAYFRVNTLEEREVWVTALKELSLSEQHDYLGIHRKQSLGFTSSEVRRTSEHDVVREEDHEPLSSSSSSSEDEEDGEYRSHASSIEVEDVKIKGREDEIQQDDDDDAYSSADDDAGQEGPTFVHDQKGLSLDAARFVLVESPETTPPPTLETKFEISPVASTEVSPKHKDDLDEENGDNETKKKGHKQHSARALGSAISRIKVSLFGNASNHPQSIEEEDEAVSSDQTDVKEKEADPPPKVVVLPEFKIITLAEFDKVEVFQNQRWLPITKWGTKMLFHDRAPYTNRVGQNLERFYFESLKGDGNQTANGVTAPNVDEEEGIRPGFGRIETVSPWTWTTQEWRSEILPCLAPPLDPPSPPGINPAQNQQIPKLGSPNNIRKKEQASARAGTEGEEISISVISDGRSRQHSSSLTRKEDVLSPTTVDEADNTWATGFEFDFFENSIARGVPRTKSESSRTNVRTRRLVRERTRTIQIKVPYSTDITPLKEQPLGRAKFINPELFVPMKGWLGKKGLHGTWSNRYFKLKVSTSPQFTVALEYYVSKENQKLKNRVLLGPDDSCRLVSDYLKLVEQGAVISQSQPVVSPTKMAIQTHGSFRDPFEESSPTSAPSPFEAREGRFEIFLRKCAHRRQEFSLLLTADTALIARAWVAALTSAIGDLREHLASLPPVLSPTLHLTGPRRKHVAKSLTSEHESLSPTGELLMRDSKTMRKRLGEGMKGMVAKASRIGKKGRELSQDHEDDASGLDEREGPESPEPKTIVDTEEEPVLAELNPGQTEQSLTDRALSRNGAMAEMLRAEFPLGMDLRSVFQHAVGDSEKAILNAAHLHKEIGDENVEMDNWKISEAISPDEDVQFSLCGSPAPCRLLTFRTPIVGAPVGPSSTRVRTFQRYCYFEKERVLVWHQANRSLDAPFGEYFMIQERWVIRQLPNEVRCTLVIFFEVLFTRNTLMKGILVRTIMSGSVKQFERLKVKIRTEFFQGSSRPESLKLPGRAGGTDVAAPKLDDSSPLARPDGFLQSFTKSPTQMDLARSVSELATATQQLREEIQTGVCLAET